MFDLTLALALHRARAQTPRPSRGPCAARWTLLALLLAAGASVAVAAPASGRKLKTVLDFDSRLVDEKGKPVTGIFRMRFGLAKSARARPYWTEAHWVAVDNGKYRVKLGRDRALPRQFDPASAAIVVDVQGAGTILREPLSGSDASLTSVEVGGGGKRIVQYAEKAGFAYDAEHATAADRVGNFTARLIEESLDRLERRKVKLKIGRNRINLTSAGGVGGIPFEQVCPPGTVMVGLRGGSGLYIDNVQVVCAPLE